MTLEKICKKLIIEDPFWGLFLMGMNKRMSDRIETAAVVKAGIGVELWINPAFWNSLTDIQQKAILLHELHHIAFNHMFMAPYFPDQDRFNIACDAEVNCYIDGLPTDDGHIECTDYGLEPQKGAKYYYDHLPQFPPNGGSPSLSDDHSKWKEFSGASSAQQELVKNQINGMLKQAAQQTIKQRGTVPGQLQAIIEALLKDKPRVFDWKAKFRRMLGTEIEVKFKKTYHRESKRFLGNPGLKFKKRIKILVAVDTSGSVSNKELAEFFAEIHHIYKAGAAVKVIEFDAKIHGEWDYKGDHKQIKITGRGGTNFVPPIEYYRNHKKEYTMFVLFTDGGAPTEELEVPNNDMTWVITAEGDHDRYYPGKVLFIPAAPEE